MYWLAVHREPVTIGTLARDIVPPAAKRELIQSLESLMHRSMAVSASGGRFSLQPVIMEFAVARLLRELVMQMTTGAVELLRIHALELATAKQYVRDAQVRILLDALACQLRETLGLNEVVHLVRRLLNRLRRDVAGNIGYGPANLLHLAIHLGLDLADLDFSQLTIREAHLQGVALRGVSFASARFERTLFTDTFGLVHSVAVSAAGDLVAAGTESGDVRVWNLADGRPVVTWREHSSTVWSVAFGNDDQILVSGSADRTVRVWDLRTRRCIQVCHGHTEAVVDVACHPHEPIVGSAGYDNIARIWNAMSGRAIHTLRGHGN
jgi:hypothetical protein